MWRSLVFLFALAGTLAYGAIQRAGIDPIDWNACLLAIGLIVGLFGFIDTQAEVGSFDGVAGVCMAVILAVVGLQLVPFPIWIVRALSPARFELHAAASLAGDHGSLVTLTATPYETVQYLLTLSGYALVILFVRNLSRIWRDSPWVTVLPLLAVSGSEAALGCYQVFLGAAADGAKGTYMNRDHFAALLEMALPFALVRPLAALRTEHARHESPVLPAIKACIGIAVFVLLLSGIMLSLSRGAFVASLVATFVVLLAIFFTGNTKDSPTDPGKRRIRRAGMCAALVLIAAGFLFLPTDSFMARFAELPSTEGVSSEMRVQIWKDTTHLIRDYPLFGCGAGSYASCFLKYKKVAPMQTVDYAHNDYLQVVAEFGIIGFVAGVVLVCRFLQLALRGARRASSADQRYVAIAGLGAMVAILLHSMVDFNMYVPANGFEFAWILGVIASFGGGSSASRIDRKRTAERYGVAQETILATI